VEHSSISESLIKAMWTETGREMTKLGWEVTIGSADEPGAVSAAGVRFVQVAPPGRYFVGWLRFQLLLALLLWRRRRDFDCVLVRPFVAPAPLALSGLARALRARRPRAVVYWDALVTAPETLKGKLWQIEFAVAWLVARLFADGHVANTRRMAQVLRIPPGQLLGLFPMGVNLETFEVAWVQRKWPRPGETVVLVYIGLLHLARGLDTLCRAVARARRSGVNVRLRVVGEGPDSGALEALAAELGGDAVSVEPPVPHSEVPKLLGEAHAGVLPYPNLVRYQVANLVKMLEYAGAGLPMVATRIAAHTDVSGETDCVFWAEDSSEAAFGEAIGKLCAGSAKLREMGERAWRLARGWTWAESARKLDAALRKLAMPDEVAVKK